MGAPLGPLQLIPPGLTGLLQLKQLGRLPDALLGDIQGVIELRDWYMNARSIGLTSQFSALPQTVNLLTGSTPGFYTMTVGAAGPVFQVPSNEWWYVFHYTVVTGGLVVTADIWNFECAWLDSPVGAGGSSYVLAAFGSGGYQNIPSATTRSPTANVPYSFWLPPGALPGIKLHDVTSAAGQFLVAQMRYVRLPV